MNHPFLLALRDPDIRRVWAGLAVQALGEEVFRIAALWLAIGLVGAQASYLSASQCVAIMVASFLAGAFVDRLAPKRLLVGTNVLRAVAAAFPAVVFLTGGDVAFWMLVASGIVLSSLRSVFEPTLTACVPALAGDTARIHALNALFDATHRLSRFFGPMVAGLLALVMPVEDLLLVTAIGFVVAAGAMMRMRRRLEIKSGPANAKGLWTRLTLGVAVARRDTVVGRIIVANGLMLVGWMLTLSLGIPMLVAERAPTGFEARPLLAVTIILGTYGLADVISSTLIAAWPVEDRWRFMFSGYVVLGFGLAILPWPMHLGFGAFELPAMMVAAFVSGFGGPPFFTNMMTIFQTRLTGADLTSVLRLRFTILGAAMSAAAFFGVFAFERFGATATLVTAAVGITSIGLWGVSHRPSGAERL